MCNGRASLNSMRSLPLVFERVSRLLKCHSNFLGIHTYILELTKLITPHANGEPLFKWSSSHSHILPPILLVVWSTNGDGIVLLLPRQVFMMILLMELRVGNARLNCFILHRTYCRARCTLNKKILNLLNEERFLEKAVVELV